MGSVQRECCNIYVGSTLEHVAIEKFYQRANKSILKGNPLAIGALKGNWL